MYIELDCYGHFDIYKIIHLKDCYFDNFNVFSMIVNFSLAHKDTTDESMRA
jgi:hypothetical protein